MDIKLLEASRTGDIQLLHQFLAENPLLLHTLALASAENLLHVASIAGHVDFVEEIVRFKPDFAKEMSNDGFSPIHIASANGYLEIVRELLKVDPRLSQLKGRDEWTPLHYAASRGRIDVIREMALSCPESVEDVTIQGETALHLAVKRSQCEAIKALVELVREMNKVNILNMKDKLGNSVLHLASRKKQHQASALEVNNVNHSGLTPLDLLLISPSEAGDREMEVILGGAGAMRAEDIVHSGVPSHNHPHAPMESDTNLLPQPDNLVEFFLQVQKGKRFSKTTSDTSNASTHYAGTDIQGSYYPVYFIVFAVFNSIGFSMSLYMIEILTTNFPLQLELHVCILAMYFAYCNSVITVAPGAGLYFLFVLTPALPRMLPNVLGHLSTSSGLDHSLWLIECKASSII
ncbi:hypothetical protein Pyn_41064 [Prunus yedoensis var. nudiflora]|uniref:Uncharacterized protein n=1 Tax=Prunus yedoensis var. nudiflora TaxID=2094558 RepID=A0A314UTR0_PRUYE|nr:hypothetical protein Pyn_04707 [Prunus yedoensis var. nudiflora]PQM39467.1 hypothetical protein Pyn_41064 [Prunus yedoensis var. nudiflora]